MEERIFGSLPSQIGDCVHGVLEVLDTHDGWSQAKWLPQGIFATISGLDLSPGKVSVYGMKVLSLPPSLSLTCTVDSWYRYSSYDSGTFSPSVIELAAGCGGMGVGAQFLGGIIEAAVDNNKLAVNHLTQNAHGKILEIDLNRMDAAELIHKELPACSMTALFGFPCQPYSHQGLRMETLDERANTLWGGLHVIWQLQTQAAILECVCPAGENSEVQDALQMFASAMQWEVLQVQLELGDQWISRRRRWWAILLPRSWCSTGLRSWPKACPLPTVGTVLTEWGVWPEEEEADLQLTVPELLFYTDITCGGDKRLLEATDQAPTILHSYSNATGPCPCLCRSAGFSAWSLKQKGLRGFFVPSAQHENPRFLHPRELGALLGLPDKMRHLTPPRAANCLIGLVASPLQMIWTYGALIENFHVAQGLDFPHTLLDLLQNYKKVIIDQLAADFPFQSGQLQQITLNTDDGAKIVLVCPLATTVGHLLQAEKINLTWGVGLRIVDHSGHVLEDEDKLQQHVYYGIQHFTKKQVRERPAGPLVIGIQHHENFILEVVPPGSFIFEILHKNGLDSVHFLKDLDGKIFGADYRLWHSIKLHTIEGHLGMIKRFRASGSGGPHHGLSAHLMWELLQQVVHQLRCFNEETNIVPLLFVDGHCHGSWQSLHDQADGGHIICIFAVNGHWAFLWGDLSDGQGHWTYFDGLRGQLTRAAFCLSRGFHQKLGLHGFAFEHRSVYSQTHPHECGVIALAHASLVLGLPGFYSAEVITELYLWLRDHDFDEGYRASGPHPGGSHSETVNVLADLLHSKGVPGPAARERAQQALDKLGHQPVLAALGSKNPWNRLKAEANRPNIMFRLVTPTELSQHIRERGESQFGASIKKDKKLPKKPTRPGPPPPHQLDVSQLVLFDDQFVDEHDLPVKQIDFAAVVAEGRGVAICTSLMAAPYIQDGRHISTDGLALALVDLPDAETCAKACISKTPIPAKYKGTDEPVLFFGGLYQLGDSEVTRKQASNMPTPEVVSTAVLRIQAFQDVYQADWMQFKQAPIKELIAMVPALQLCREDACSKGAIAACLKTHPAVDENFDQVILDIWARTYTTADGKKTSQHEALSFAAFLRVPSSALNSILQQQPAGIFFEPRCSATKGPDPQFKIVWLPGHDYSAALHQAKICPKSICIMRVRQRYGGGIQGTSPRSSIPQCQRLHHLPTISTTTRNSTPGHRSVVGWLGMACPASPTRQGQC